MGASHRQQGVRPRIGESPAASDYNRIVRLIRDYEEEADLLPIFKSRSYVCDVINAKRTISKANPKQLAEFFNVSASVFI